MRYTGLALAIILVAVLAGCAERAEQADRNREGGFYGGVSGGTGR